MAAPQASRTRGDLRSAIVLAFLFGVATAIKHGRWSLGAFLVLVGALGVLGWRFVAGVRSGSPGAASPPAGRAEQTLLLALLAAMPVAALLDRTILPEPEVARWTAGRAAEVLSVALVLSYAPFLTAARTEPRALRELRFAALGALLVVAGVAAIRVSPAPGIDVWTIQMQGADLLLDGKNPYALVAIPDTDPETDFTVPYCYPPFAIYAGVLGRLLLGDVRYAHLACVIVAGVALRATARRLRAATGDPVPSLVEDAPALALWLWPPLLMILDRSWIDPIQLVLVTVAVAAWVSGRTTASAVLFGVAITSKQSMFWLAPLAVLVLRFDLRRVAVMALAGLVPLLPFLAWDFRRLKYANFDFMSGLAPRHDGLCFTSWVHHTFGVAFPPAVGFLLAAAVVLVACVRRPVDPADRPASALAFSRAVLATYFVFFFFNRWAFANYYFLLAGLSALMAATAVRGAAARAGAP